jgi:hypothetical protein
MLRALKGYVYHRDTIDKPLRTLEDWDELIPDTFNQFRVSTSWIVISETGLDGAPFQFATGTATTTTGAPFLSPSCIRDPVNDFKRGIKCDIVAHPDLKQGKGWDKLESRY